MWASASKQNIEDLAEYLSYWTSKFHVEIVDIWKSELSGKMVVWFRSNDSKWKKKFAVESDCSNLGANEGMFGYIIKDSFKTVEGRTVLFKDFDKDLLKELGVSEND